jgi:hypothetical protein
VSGFVAGRSSARARTLLDLADHLGIPQVAIRTTEDGYIVPDAVHDAYVATLAPTPEPAPEPDPAPAPPTKKPAPRSRKAQDKEQP